MSEFQCLRVQGEACHEGMLDQAGFLDEAAQLYEMAGAFASGHDPSPRIGAALSGLSPASRPRQLRRRPIRHSEGGA